jgi:transposase/predicted transcriptional regulator
MIDAFLQGRIFQAMAMRGDHDLKTIQAIASKLRVSPRTVRKFSRPVKKKKAKKAPSPTRRERLNALIRLNRMRVKKQHRTFVRYSSAAQLRAALTTEIKKLGFTIPSTRQVQRDLRSLGLKPYIRQKVPTRIAADKVSREEFARMMRTWSLKDVRSIVFSDESWLSCCERTGRVQWAKSKDQVLGLEKKARWNSASLLVFAAVGIGYKSALIILPSKTTDEDGEKKTFRLNAETYCKLCIRPIAASLKGRKLMQDGARSHVARQTIGYLKQRKIDVVEKWPAYSPDWNPIERIWNELKRVVGQRCPLNEEELKQVAREEWERLPQDLIDRHCYHFETQLGLGKKK